jgi:hypothetical protein
MDGERRTSDLNPRDPWTGYASPHVWVRARTAPGAAASHDRMTYQCAAGCGAAFVHRYLEVPDVLEALAESGTPERCRATGAIDGMLGEVLRAHPVVAEPGPTASEKSG